MLQQIRAGYGRVKTVATAHEGAMTCILVAVAAVLVAVALFGRVEHKVAAMVYIVF